jgi:hypothetical protein
LVQRWERRLVWELDNLETKTNFLKENSDEEEVEV